MKHAQIKRVGCEKCTLWSSVNGSRQFRSKAPKMHDESHSTGRRSCILESGKLRRGIIRSKDRVEMHSKFSKLIVYATLISEFVAANLMDRRGESWFSIARNAAAKPVASLGSEVKNVV
jgi:hypothetical protein